MTRPHRITALVAIVGASVALDGCARAHQTIATQVQHRVAASCGHEPTPPSAASPSCPLGNRPTASESATPAAPVALQTIPPAHQAVRNPLTMARAWAYAAHSVNYRDWRPGAWTSRAAPFVDGAERAAEKRASSGGGGQQWRDIQAKHCAMTLTDLAAVTPSDAPRTATARVVYLAGTTSLNCADGTQQRSTFAAQTIVERQSNRWHATTVTH